MGAVVRPARCRFLVTVTAANAELARELRAQRQLRVEQNKLQLQVCSPRARKQCIERLCAACVERLCQLRCE